MYVCTVPWDTPPPPPPPLFSLGDTGETNRRVNEQTMAATIIVIIIMTSKR